MSGSRIIATTVPGPVTVASGVVSVTSSGGVTAANYAVTVSGGSLSNAGGLSGAATGLLAGGGEADNLAGGRITGGSEAGVSLSGAALLVNSGLVSGGSVGIDGVGFVTNYGTIAGSGTAGYAVSFASGAISSLVVEPGGVFLGAVKGGGSASTLEFAGTRVATVTGLGSRYVGFGLVDVALGANWTASGADSVSAGQTVSAYGMLVANGTFANAGMINGMPSGLGVGIYFAGGMLANAGTLYGATSGLRAPNGFGGTITNTGVVAASSATGTGAYLYHATFFNEIGGSVRGATGMDLGRSASLANYAGVSGAVEGVYMSGGAVANEAGAVIAGGSFGVHGYGTVINAGTIAAATQAGFAISFASTVDSLLIIDPGASFIGTVDGGGVTGSLSASTLEFASGTGTFSGFGSSVVGFGQISLDPGANWLLAGSAAGFGGGEAISGLGAGSTIELVGTTESYGALAGGVLTLSGGTTLGLPGVTHASVDASGGNTFITACFVSGTRIMTEVGTAAVESLAVGDLVLTASGRLAPIRWIGRRRVDLRRHPRHAEAMPVRVWRDAFGNGLPWRDLVLSPDHAVFMRGALVPLRHLVNGVSIVQERRDTVTYWHVELDRHDVILAEGLACESYLDTGNRAAFENAPWAVTMTPDFARGVWARGGCAEILTDPADTRLRSLHTHLLARARREAAPALRRA